MANILTPDNVVDLSGIVTDAVNLVIAAATPALIWLGHRAVSIWETHTGLAASQAQSDQVDALIELAVDYVQGRLPALADQASHVAISNQLVAEAAQLVSLHAPAALIALGLTPTAVESKIRLSVGAPPIQPAATPQPDPAIPPPAVTSVAATSGVAAACAILFAAVSLSACTAAQQAEVQAAITTVDAAIPKACQDYAEAKSVASIAVGLLPQQAATVTNLEAYGDSICAVPSPQTDAGTAAWVASIASNISSVAQQPQTSSAGK